MYGKLKAKFIVSRICMSLAAITFALYISSCGGPDNKSLPQSFERKVVDTNPSATPLSPAQSIKKIQLPPGFHIELVASEPMVQEPVAFCWDGNGRMYVAEMNTYMKDAMPQVNMNRPAGSNFWKIRMVMAKWISQRFLLTALFCHVPYLL